MLTHSHSLKIKTKVHEVYPDNWNIFVGQSAINQRDHFTVLNEIVKSRIPVYYVKYEDLLLQAPEVMTELMCYLLNVESIEGTVAEARIK
jgi:hypothetical protein